MSNKIGIDVDASFNSGEVNKGLDAIQRKIDQINANPIDVVPGDSTRGIDQLTGGVEDLAAAVNAINGKQINPVSPNAGKQLDALNRKFQELLKVDAELRRRLKVTGQEGALFQNVNWNDTHPNERARAAKIASTNAYLGIPGAGGSGHSPMPPSQSGGGSGGRPGGGLGGMALNVAQAGLRAGGSFGGVASNALGSGAAAGSSGGMAAGIGAGLAGLAGGVLAMGISKIVGSVVEKVGQAEDNNVMYDRLKRSIGDVNVSFDGLKAAVTGGADKLKITYSEMGALSQSFAKAANLKSGEYTSIPDELGVGVGLSRAYGLDPGQGVGVMGQMRGVGATSNIQDSRRFALLIGETIGKSGAFAKADEVMEAMGNYATTQTRSSMGGANVEGFAGMFSAMVGSGKAGLDPTGAGAILSRINSTLSAGGAKGEASQFFTGQVGNRMGLDPLQTQVMREGGAFATNDKMFGKGSAYADYMGKEGPKGGSTFLQNTMDQLKKQYGGDSDSDKLLRAQAMANHTGVNMNQAMRLMTLKPNSMGRLEGYAGDLTKLNASGIGNLSKVVDGSDADRRGVADSLLARDDVGSDQKKSINDVMGGTDVEKQKQILAEIIASRDQEKSTGSDIRDSKNLLDNLKVSIADKLVPLTQDMRAGILYIAGKGNKTGDDVLRDIANMEAKDKSSRIGKIADGERKGINEDYDKRIAGVAPGMSPGDITKEQWHKDAGKKIRDGTITPEEKTEFEARVKKYGEDRLAAVGNTEIAAKKRELDEERRKLLGDVDSKEKEALNRENESLRKKLRDIDTSKDGLPVSAVGSGAAGGRASFSDAGFEAARTGGSSGGNGGGPVDPKRGGEALKFFMDKGWTKEQAAGIVANLNAESGMKEGIHGDGGSAYGIAQWHGDRQDAFKKKYGKDIKGSSFKEQLEFVNHELTAGNEQAAGNRLRGTSTAGQAGSAVSEYYERPKNRYGDSAARAAAAEKIAKGTKMPDDAAATPGRTPAPDGVGAGAGRGEDPRKFMIGAEDVTIKIVDGNNKKIAPDQKIQTVVKPAGQSLVKQ